MLPDETSTVNPLPVGQEIHDTSSLIESTTFSDFISDLSHKLVTFAINLAIAIFVFYIGKFIIKRLYKVLATIFIRRQVDNSLATFLLSLVKIVLYFILIVTVIGILGVETTSFLALFASAGVAIGMALSGTLQNFAGGVLILLLKPYKVGDYIETQGYAGTVREIQIFHTVITTYDNKAILLPNGVLSTASINNWSREEVRRVSWDVSISYGDSVDAARQAILGMFEGDDRILCDSIDNADGTDKTDDGSCPVVTDQEGIYQTVAGPKKPGFLTRLFSRRKRLVEQADQEAMARYKAMLPQVIKTPEVLVNQMADSSVVLTVRVWVRTTNYWDVYFHYNERFYTELPSHGINFPFPQMDVHMK